MTQPESHPDLVRLMEAGIAGGVFPGGALLVRVRGQTVHLSFHGRARFNRPAVRWTRAPASIWPR
jgi:hypothetical protein